MMILWDVALPRVRCSRGTKRFIDSSGDFFIVYVFLLLLLGSACSLQSECSASFFVALCVRQCVDPGCMHTIILNSDQSFLTTGPIMKTSLVPTALASMDT